MVLHLFTAQRGTASTNTLYNLRDCPLLRLNISLVTISPRLPERLHKHRGQNGHQLGDMALILSQKATIGSQQEIDGRR